MNRRFIHEPGPTSSLSPIVEVAPTSPFGYRLRLDGREVGPKISTQYMAEYLRNWLEFAYEELHRG